MDGGGEALPDVPTTIDDARSEFGSAVPRLRDDPNLELAALGVFRREGRLTAVSQSYFDRRKTVSPPQTPSEHVPEWLFSWISRQSHPLLEDVIQTWAADEFGGEQPSAELMLRIHLSATGESTEVTATSDAFDLDGKAQKGFSADDEHRLLRAAQIGDVSVMVNIPIDLVDGTPHLTVH